MSITLAELRRRRSVRRYDSRTPEPAVLTALRAAVTDVNTHEAGMHFQLFTDDPEPFRGLSRNYGVFSGVHHYIAAVADTSYACYRERAGYCGMQIVMKAVELGLGTCFVSGTYSPAYVAARVRVGEALLYIITFGYEAEEQRPRLMAGLLVGLMHRHEPEPSDFLVTSLPHAEIEHELPRLPELLAALACAPSARNKRPARLRVSREGEALRLSMFVEQSTPARLIDLGIAVWSVCALLDAVPEWGNPTTILW